MGQPLSPCAEPTEEIEERVADAILDARLEVPEGAWTEYDSARIAVDVLLRARPTETGAA